MASIAEIKTPGVYILEIPTFPPSVSAVGTGIPAFIGYTETAIDSLGKSLFNVPKRISSMLEYTNYFGGSPSEGEQDAIKVTVRDKKMDGSTDLLSSSITVEVDETKRSPFLMYFSLQLYFANGGGPCYIISVGDYTKPNEKPALGDITKPDEGGFLVGLQTLRSEDEPTLIVFPDGKGLNSADYYTLQKTSLQQCNELQDRFAIIDVHVKDDEANDLEKIKKTFRDGIGTNFLKYGAAYFPQLETIFDFVYDEDKVKIVHTVTTVKNDGTSTDAPGTFEGKKLKGDVKAGNVVLYERIKTEIKSAGMILPASPAIAGVYASVDRDRGVWKAPANVSLNAVIKPSFKLNDKDQEDLNVSDTGKSINAIRSFIGKGTMVWGARTLDGGSNDWRYIPVRRLFIMVEESVKKATYQFVFEPNDANTWVRVRAMIENFLTLLWRDGALAGTKPEQAFYVKVGLNQTMTAIDILEGRMIIEIGMAAVRPAEFIVLKFSHKMQES
jgi:phage tail sheath protein FI